MTPNLKGPLGSQSLKCILSYNDFLLLKLKNVFVKYLMAGKAKPYISELAGHLQINKEMVLPAFFLEKEDVPRRSSFGEHVGLLGFHFHLA